MRVRLDVAYDGRDFSGWAKQPGLRTVQGVLEDTIRQVTRLGEPVDVQCAGRTDAGVHAHGQVTHVDLPDRIESPRHDQCSADAALTRWLPRALPGDIVIRSVAEAPPGFDARFSALWRRYVYRLVDDPTNVDPLTRGFTVLTHGPLNVDAMAAAAQTLLGLNDFAAFSRPKEHGTTVRTLMMLAPMRTHTGIEITVQADAFCHSMVRSLTGALVAIGQGKRDQTWLESLLNLRHRANDIIVMPARGLTLEHVCYPPDDELASRARQARTRRDGIDCSGDTPAPMDDPHPSDPTPSNTTNEVHP